MNDLEQLLAYIVQQRQVLEENLDDSYKNREPAEIAYWAGQLQCLYNVELVVRRLDSEGGS